MLSELLFFCLVVFVVCDCSFLFQLCDLRFRESDNIDENNSSSGKQQKLSKFGIVTSKRKSEEIESSGKEHCKFFRTRKLEQVTHF